MAKAYPKKFYQHRHGGVYQVENPCVLSTIDKSEWVSYTHAWPFDTLTWIRPKDEWEEEGRFREIDGGELELLLSKDRDVFQEEIHKSKEESKKDK